MCLGARRRHGACSTCGAVQFMDEIDEQAGEASRVVTVREVSGLGKDD
jgi:hypothetical protein